MDIQLKKGMLDIVVLAVLSSADSYGYKIVQDVAPVITISESTLYPILRRLESADCLGTYLIEHNGRLRKYYKIKQEGINRIKTFMLEWGKMKQVYDFILLSAKLERGSYE